MEAIVYIAQSLDGFIADQNGGLEWLNTIPNPSGSDYGFAAFMANIDAVVMGRNTFETVATFEGWPYVKPVFVVSRSLDQLPAKYDGKASLLSLEPAAIMAHLGSLGLDRLYIDGGSLIQSFLKASLIDQLIITTVPIILGAGTPLFSDHGVRSHWRLTNSEILNNALIKTTYTKASGNPG